MAAAALPRGARRDGMRVTIGVREGVPADVWEGMVADVAASDTELHRRLPAHDGGRRHLV